MTRHLPDVRRDPLGNMFTLHDEVRDLFRDFFWDGGTGWNGRRRDASPWSPAVDIEETDRAYLVTADLPGVEAKDVKITIEDQMLSLRGERRSEAAEHKHGQHRLERVWGSFERSFSLPLAVDAEHAKAAYKDGVLTLTLPKKEGAGAKTIEVKVG